MIMEYASRHSWFKPVHQNTSFDYYGKSDRKKLKKTLTVVESADIRHVIQPANEEFFTWFAPLYNTVITTKKNALDENIKAKTFERTDKPFPYYTLTVFEDNEPVGGCIFSDRGDRFSIAYRVFNKNWKNSPAPASPALYGEYLLDEHTRTENKQQLVHGLDRNPYGLNSGIGLCTFKLSVGCTAKIPNPAPEFLALNTETLETDVLLLNPPEKGNIITRATLFTHEDQLPRYTQLLKYPERLLIDIKFRK